MQKERHPGRDKSAGDKNEHRPRPKTARAIGAERRTDCGTDHEHGRMRPPHVSDDGMTKG